MLMGGLLKVIVHRPGWVRSLLNCEGSDMAYLLNAIAASNKIDAAAFYVRSTLPQLRKQSGGILKLLTGASRFWPLAFPLRRCHVRTYTHHVLNFRNFDFH
jgi:hypothetical protein